MKMALKRKVIGSIYKSKDPLKPNYVKIKESVKLEAGQTVRAESKKFQLESLNRAVEQGKLKDVEMVSKIRERIEATPDFVIAELVLLQEVN